MHAHSELNIWLCSYIPGTVMCTVTGQFVTLSSNASHTEISESLQRSQVSLLFSGTWRRVISYIFAHGLEGRTAVY